MAGPVLRLPIVGRMPASRRLRRLLALGLVGALATVALVAGGVWWLGGEEDVPEEGLRSVPLEEYDDQPASLVRAPFCDLVDPRAVAEALGGEPASSDSWTNGDRVQLESGLTDVAHEHGCSLSGDGTAARAWVFAPPVSAARAAELVAEAQGGAGCAAVPDAPAYGSPTVALACEEQGVTRVSYRGLFGDAWLVCERSGAPGEAPAEAADRAGRWCAAVLRAAAAGQGQGARGS